MEWSSGLSCIGPVLRGLQEPTQAAVPLLIWLWPFLLALLQSSAPCLVCTRHKFCVPVLAHLCTALSTTILGSLLLKRTCTSRKIDRSHFPLYLDLIYFIFKLFQNRPVLQSARPHAFNRELSICTTDESRTVELTLWVVCACVNFVIHRSSRFYNTQRTWQLLWWQHNVWCFTVAEAVHRANRKLPNCACQLHSSRQNH